MNHAPPGLHDRGGALIYQEGLEMGENYQHLTWRERLIICIT